MLGRFGLGEVESAAFETTKCVGLLTICANNLRSNKYDVFHATVSTS